MYLFQNVAFFRASGHIIYKASSEYSKREQEFDKGPLPILHIICFQLHPTNKNIYLEIYL